MSMEINKDAPDQSAPKKTPSLGDIPKEAFKQAICKCGHDVFCVGSTYSFYPGGKHSERPVAVAGDPMLICARCNQPFMNIMNPKPATEKKSFKQRVRGLFNKGKV